VSLTLFLLLPMPFLRLGCGGDALNDMLFFSSLLHTRPTTTQRVSTSVQPDKLVFYYRPLRTFIETDYIPLSFRCRLLQATAALDVDARTPNAKRPLMVLAMHVSGHNRSMGRFQLFVKVGSYWVPVAR
jgi:hypothetical protein